MIIIGKTIKYNKLVRDEIPAIIDNKGKKAVTHIADDDEYVSHLYMKVKEELDEFIEHPCLEEMADLLEVLGAISEHYQLSMTEIERVKYEKKAARGAFKERIILDEVTE